MVQYNQRVASEINVDMKTLGMPEIQVLRMCLLSGGSYKHPATSKVEVAKSILNGILRGSSGCYQWTPSVSFAYDEDAFRRGWNDLGFYGTEPWIIDGANLHCQRAEVSWCRKDMVDSQEDEAILSSKKFRFTTVGAWQMS